MIKPLRWRNDGISLAVQDSQQYENNGSKKITLLAADYFAVGKFYLRDEKKYQEVIFKFSFVQNSINFLIRQEINLKNLHTFLIRKLILFCTGGNLNITSW